MRNLIIVKDFGVPPSKKFSLTPQSVGRSPPPEKNK